MGDETLGDKLKHAVEKVEDAFEPGPNTDKGGVHGRDVGEHKAEPDRDVGGVHGRDESAVEPGPDKDLGGVHGRDVGEH